MIMKMGGFRFFFYLIMKVIFKVSHFCHFIMVLSSDNEKSRKSNFAEKYLPPFHAVFFFFFVQNILIQK